VFFIGIAKNAAKAVGIASSAKLSNHVYRPDKNDSNLSKRQLLFEWLRRARIARVDRRDVRSIWSKIVTRGMLGAFGREVAGHLPYVRAKRGLSG